MLAADTSALFLIATAPVPADALTALGRFGGKLLATSLVADPRGALAPPPMGSPHRSRGLPLPRQE